MKVLTLNIVLQLLILQDWQQYVQVMGLSKHLKGLIS
jgi:hypothetical protein